MPSFLERSENLDNSNRVRPATVRLSLVPDVQKRGKNVQVQTSFLDEFGRLLTVDAIFLRVLDESGIEVYPPQKIASNQAGFAILIGTRDFKPGIYRVQVSNSEQFTPHQSRELTVQEPDDVVAGVVVPVVDVKTLQRTRSPDRRTKAGFVPIVPILPSIPLGDFAFGGEVIFNTEEDDRVCPICESHEGEIYELPDDEDIMPEIPLHPNCRCWYVFIETGERILSTGKKQSEVDVEAIQTAVFSMETIDIVDSVIAVHEHINAQG